MIGQSISHYNILEKLGSGGMGVVYKAKDTKLKRFVALKFLPTGLTRDEDAKARFVHEAQATSALDHVNICTIYEINETDDGQMFIAMAYYEGETLQKKMSPEAGLAVDSSIDIAIQIAQGLAKAHEHGITHRDIKPANVVITKDGVAKILDFGLAKLAGQPRLTKTGSTLGTMAYMSPEQARGEEVDHRTDIWSLGVVLYEMLTGQLPFRGEHEHTIMFKILQSSPKPVSEIIQDIPRPLEIIVSKALEKRPGVRYQSADAIFTDLLEAKKDLGPSSGPLAPRPPFLQLWKRIYSWMKNNVRLVLFFFLILLITTASIVVYKILRPTTPTPGNGYRKIYIAVMYFENNSNNPAFAWLRRGIPDMLTTDLGNQSPYLRVISLEKLDEIIAALGHKEKAVDRGMALQIARSAGANVIITGSIIQDGSKVRILTQLYDLKADSLIMTEKLPSQNLETIIPSIDSLALQMKLKLEITASGTPGITAGIVKTKTRSVEAYKHYVLGVENLEKAQYPEAVKNLLKAVEIDSTFAYAYAELTHAYDILGERNLAKHFIRKATKSSLMLPEIDQINIQLQEAQLLSNWEAALAYLQQLVVLQPDNADVHSKLAWHYVTHLRAYESGIREYKKAIALKPVEEPLLHYYLGHAYLNFGQRDEAIAAFKAYLTLLPNTANAHDALGFACLLTGDYDKALNECNEALRLVPNFLTALANLGDLACARGRRNEALSYYKHYLDTALGQNKEKRGHCHLARFYLENDELPKATEEIQKALATDSLMIEALWLQGLIALQTRHFDFADTVARRMEGVLKDSRSDYAKEFFHHLKGRIELARNHPDLAIQEFEQALKLGPLEQDYFRFALAEAYFQKGDWARCLSACENVLAYNPQYATAYVLLGKTYEHLNSKGEALRAYEKCLAIWKDADENLPLMEEAKNRLSRLLNRK